MTKKQLFAGSGALLVVALLLGAGAVQMYQVRQLHSESRLVTAVANVFGMDIAKVDGKKVPYSEYVLHARAERTFLQSPMGKQQGSTGDFGPAEEQQAFNRALRVAAVDALAREYKIEVTSKDVDAAFTELLAQSSSSTNAEEVDTFLREQFGWSTDQFKHYVLRPAIIEETLKAKFSDKPDPTAAVQAAIDEVLSKKTDHYLKF